MTPEEAEDVARNMGPAERALARAIGRAAFAVGFVLGALASWGVGLLVGAV